MKDLTIKDIEDLTIKDLKELEKQGNAEYINIKEHDCYFVKVGNTFGYSVLVFKNGKHIYYANDYELHHSGKTKEELKQYYIKQLNYKLFTEFELLEDIYNYDEYTRKANYLHNYWIMQFNHVSAFYIGKPDKEQEEAKENMYYCSTCFCYVEDKRIVEKAQKLINHIQKSFSEVKNNKEVFRKMIAYELANHEACITYDYKNALDSLGLKFEELAEEQQKIVQEELKKQIYAYRV